MAIFGNQNTDGTSEELASTNQYGHWDLDYMAAWGSNNVPACTVNKIWFKVGATPIQLSCRIRLAIYNCDDVDPDDWWVEGESPYFEMGGDQTLQWYSVNCNLILTAGKKALAILAYDGHFATWLKVAYTPKPSGPSIITTPSEGTFRDPLDLNYIPSSETEQNWCMYAEYTAEEGPPPPPETTTITSDARIVNPKIFTFASPAAAISKSFDTDVTAFDIKLKHICNHKLSNSQYTLGKCPRCLGTGYYYDIKFNDMGKLVEISLEDKLQQALEKLVLTDENKFHEDVAIGLKKWLGEVPISKIKAIIKYDLVKSLAELQEIQRGVPNLSGYAQIASVDNIEVYENSESPDTLEYLVEVTTVSGDTKKLTGIVTVGE